MALPQCPKCGDRELLVRPRLPLRLHADGSWDVQDVHENVMPDDKVLCCNTECEHFEVEFTVEEADAAGEQQRKDDALKGVIGNDAFEVLQASGALIWHV